MSVVNILRRHEQRLRKEQQRTASERAQMLLQIAQLTDSADAAAHRMAHIDVELRRCVELLEQLRRAPEYTVLHGALDPGDTDDVDTSSAATESEIGAAASPAAETAQDKTRQPCTASPAAETAQDRARRLRAAKCRIVQRLESLIAERERGGEPPKFARRAVVQKIAAACGDDVDERYIYGLLNPRLADKRCIARKLRRIGAALDRTHPERPSDADETLRKRRRSADAERPAKRRCPLSDEST